MGDIEDRAALELILNVGGDYTETWEAVQILQALLNDTKEDLEGACETGCLYPTTADISTEELASKIKEYCDELTGRDREKLDRDIDAARAIWPDIREALQQKGKNIPIGKPVVSPCTDKRIGIFLKDSGRLYPYKVRRKSIAIRESALHGYHGWWTVPDYILWLHDAGPIMEASMRDYGYKTPKLAG